VVSSAEDARFLLVAEPARTLAIRPPPTEPPDLGRLVAVAADYGIEILDLPAIPS
jgi:hypothetical protein